MKNIIKSLSISLFILTIVLNGSSFAADNLFKKNNPDGKKYEFARSYISALKYFYNINERWSKNPPKKLYKGDDIKTIHGSMDYLVQDNAELRIAKNYMIKYLTTPNSLIKKVSDMMIVSCDQGIALNNKAKNLWQDLLNIKAQGKVKPEQEQSFVKAQRDIELKRKEVDKSIIKASVLMTKVMLSQNNSSDKGHLLAITEKERSKLVDDLDEYGKSVIDWGLKPGQSTLQASVAVIREVLEDPIFIASK